MKRPRTAVPPILSVQQCVREVCYIVPCDGSQIQDIGWVHQAVQAI